MPAQYCTGGASGGDRSCTSGCDATRRDYRRGAACAVQTGVGKGRLRGHALAHRRLHPASSGLHVSGPGIKFGHFTLGKRLARGGMAEVFLARQRGPEGFDRRVAVKRILPHLAETPDFVRMFLDEARLAARLSHPNVVHIYELGQVDGDYFIAMEFVDGIHCGQLTSLAAIDLLPPVLAARLGADAASALAYAHRLEDVDGRPLQLVHRDVSPHNIMVSFDGVTKLVDFGIAKAALKADETRPGIVKGKYAYMSPEQTVGRPLDGRSDVFSLGICLWEILAGTTIVDRSDVVEAMKVIRDGRYLPIEQVAPRTPPALAQAIGWALAHKRDDRATAAQLQVALEEFIKGSPQIATSGQLAEWIRPRFPRAATGAAPIVDDEPRLPQRPSRRTAPPPPATVPIPITGATPVMRPGTAVVPITEHVRAVPESQPVRAVPPPLPAAVRGRAPTHLDVDVEVPDDSHDAPTRRHLPSTIMPVSRRSRAPLAIAIGLAVVIAIGLAVVIAGGGGQRAAAIDATIATIDPDAAPEVVALPGDPVDAGRAIDAAIAVDAATAAPPDAMATLEVITRPTGATIRLADRASQRTPATVTLRPGRVTFTVSRDGYTTIERTVTVAAGEHRSVELVLDRRGSTARPTVAVGYLTVRTTPYSVVTVAGRALGETPFAQVALPAGTHVLTFTNPDRGTVKRTVRIQPGKTLKLSFAL